jgi:hypothetical protein
MEVAMAALISPASAMETMTTHMRLERMTARVWRGLPVKPRSLLPSCGPPAREMNLERTPYTRTPREVAVHASRESCP